MADNSLEVFEHVIVAICDKGKVCFFSEGLHRPKSKLMFSEGMDVRVIPEGSDLHVFSLKGLYYKGGTGAAANVKKNRRHLLKKP